MRRLPLLVCLGVLFVLAAWGHTALGVISRAPAPPRMPTRIVSLSPAITETLYALGLGPAVVGVTRYCAYPPQAADLPQVAGFSDVNHEAVLRSRPDLVVMPNDRVADRLDLERLGLPVLTQNALSVAGLLQSIADLGRETQRQAEADALLATLRQGMEKARLRAEGRARPKVLFSVMRSYQGMGQITEIHAVGRDGFYSELITAAGGTNAYQGDLPFPRLSREALLFLNPDVIIDVVPGHEDASAAQRDWHSLTSVNAVKNGRLFVLTDQADTVPGPRFVRTLGRLSKAFHPEPRGAHAAD